MASSNETYLIVGAGVFGTSTARHLKLNKPWAKVILIDRTPFPNPSSASYDRSKIVRADYADLFYMELALEAQQEWRENPLFRRHYHETGIAFAEKVGTGRAAIDNYKTLNLEVPAQMLSLEDARSMWGGAFKNANWDGVKEIYWNPESGYADAEDTMRDTIQEVLSKGVIYYEATVSALILDGNGTCVGVRTNQDDLRADFTILCAGAYTAKLLADTAPTNMELQVNGRLVAAGAVSGTAELTPELIAEFKDAPVLFTGLPHTHGESVPVNGEGLLKFNCEDSFTNLKYTPYSHQQMSIPPLEERYCTWGSGQNIPKGLRDEVDSTARSMYGDAVRIDSYRMCWDSITPTQDFLISPHPHCKNLYIAAGGSFHAWKFLPIIGKYVVQMMDGKLEKGREARWAWDTVHKGAACKMYDPSRDIKNIVGSDLNGI